MKPLVMLLVLVCFVPSAAVLADIEKRLGRDLVKRSLNKKIIITPRGTWTEHRAGNTGIDIIIVPCRPEAKRMKKKSTRDDKKGFRTFDVQPSAHCR